jgi:ribose 5-phosphate isomerase B
MSNKLVMACDPFGVALKNSIKEYLVDKGYEIIDLGTDSLENFVPYYEIGARIARAIQNGVAERGVLICGSGMCVSLTANKFKGIYAGLVESEFTAESCKTVNNCNILAMGAKVISEFRAIQAVELWLTKEFANGTKGELCALLQDGLDGLAKIEEENMK